MMEKQIPVYESKYQHLSYTGLPTYVRCLHHMDHGRTYLRCSTYGPRPPSESEFIMKMTRHIQMHTHIGADININIYAPPGFSLSLTLSAGHDAATGRRGLHAN